MWLTLARPLFARAVVDASDAKLERRFGSRLMQRAMFTAMAAAFDPQAAAGFEGRLSYELELPATARPAARWTVEVTGRRARVRRGAADEAELKLRLRLSDFVRVGAGVLDPAIPMLQSRASFEGDFGLAARLPEMFGATPRR
jgi:putative sterol carrier protein